jgi:hypothetical protein
MVQRLRERERRGKKSIVRHRGAQVPEKKIDKQRKVHEYQTTIERYAPCRSTIVLVAKDW